jgi:hypothetical protein
MHCRKPLAGDELLEINQRDGAGLGLVGPSYQGKDDWVASRDV